MAISIALKKLPFNMRFLSSVSSAVLFASDIFCFFSKYSTAFFSNFYAGKLQNMDSLSVLERMRRPSCIASSSFVYSTFDDFMRECNEDMYSNMIERSALMANVPATMNSLITNKWRVIFSS